MSIQCNCCEQELGLKRKAETEEIVRLLSHGLTRFRVFALFGLKVHTFAAKSSSHSLALAFVTLI